MKLGSAAAVVCLAVALVLASAGPAAATTAFALRGKSSQVVAWSYDAPTGSAELVLNRRGLVKRALVAEGVEPVSWVSGYGSLTLNQLGADFPLAGINQAGLAVVALPLDDAGYAPRSHRAEVDPLQWVQYCLDSFENVNQVVFSAEQYRISGPVGYHFLACDGFGTCAIVEPIGGEVVSRSGDKLPLAMLTTRTFDTAIDYLNVSLGYAGKVTETGNDAVLDGFVTMVDKVNVARGRKTATPADDSFTILHEVDPDATFRLVLEPAGRRAQLELDGRPWTVELMAFDLECKDPARALIVPPRPQVAPAEAFGAPDAAAIAEIAGKAAAGTAGLDASAAAAAATHAAGYQCSERPPIKLPTNPGAAAVD